MAAMQRHVVDGTAEAVPFVRGADVLDREAAVAQGDDDLLRLGLLHARVVRPLDDEERGLDLRGGVERRLPLELLLPFRGVRVPHPGRGR